MKDTKKFELDPLLAVLLVFIGVVVVSMVFGMLLFPVFTKICAASLLQGIAKVGYFGICVALSGILLEAYNLYEHHKKHVQVLIALSIVMGLATGGLIYLISRVYSC